MLTSLMHHLHAWIIEAPWLMLIMLAGALLVFWWVLRSNDVFASVNAKAKWLSITVQAITMPLALLLILWGVRVTLARTDVDFSKQHGRVSQVNLESVEKIWGSPHVQRDLQVSHYYMQPVSDEVRDELGRIVKRTHNERVEVPQNSVTSTRGEMTLTRSERKKGSAKYPGFILQCHLVYHVRNFAERDTIADYAFPLSHGQSKFDNFIVLVNGVDQSGHLNLDSDGATWSMPMTPGQENTVDVSYTSQGLQRFYYQVSDAREIRDFLLTLTLPDIARKDINYPEGCIPPTTIGATANGHGSVLSWQLNRALTTRGMGIALPNPVQPGQQVALVLRFAWRGGMLLLVTLAITGIVLGRGFSVLTMALLGGVFAGEFMLLAALCDLFPSFWLPWLLTAALAVVLSYLILGGRNTPKPMLLLPIIFMALYPLLALPEDINTSLLTGVDVLSIVYLAVLGMMSMRGKAAIAVEGGV